MALICLHCVLLMGIFDFIVTNTTIIPTTLPLPDSFCDQAHYEEAKSSSYLQWVNYRTA